MNRCVNIGAMMTTIALPLSRINISIRYAWPGGAAEFTCHGSLSNSIDVSISPLIFRYRFGI